MYERTERRGPLFEQMRRDIDAIAALTGMQDVFKLRSADVYRVVAIEQVPRRGTCDDGEPRAVNDASRRAHQLAELSTASPGAPTSTRSSSTALAGLAELFGYEHSLLLLLDEHGERLYTIASHGYDDRGRRVRGRVGEGIIGMAAAAPSRCASATCARC